MTIDKIRSLAILLSLVFIGAAATQFLTNQVNVFESDWSTWQIVINSGIVAAVTALVGFIAPYYKDYGMGSKKDGPL